MSLIPAMRVRPIALETVAGLIANHALAGPGQALVQACGPQTTTMWAMTGRVPHPGIVRVPLIIPTSYGWAFHRGALVPGQDVPQMGPSFEEWLERGPAQSA